VLLSRASLWPQGDAAWVLALLAGGVILWTQRHRGAARATAASVDGEAIEPVRRNRVLLSISIVLAVLVVAFLAAAAIVATAFHVHVSDGIGDRTYQAAGIADVHRQYKLGVGGLRIDLRGAQFPVGETPVTARVGIGELKVIVPADVALRVTATSRVGDVHVLALADDGHNATVRLDGDGRRVLVLDARVGLGTLHVVRAPLTR
jgi:hypothetical protein